MSGRRITAEVALLAVCIIGGLVWTTVIWLIVR